MQGLPPVILYGIEEVSTGLAMVRELGERGVPVYAVLRFRTPAAYSRFLTRAYAAPTEEADVIALMNPGRPSGGGRGGAFGGGRH